MPPPNRPGKNDNRLTELWRINRTDHIQAGCWSPDDQTLAVAEIGGPILLLSAQGQLRHQLSGHGFGTLALDWQPGGALLASAGQDGRVRLWQTTTGQQHAELPAGAGWAECVKWSPDGQILASSAGKKVRLWTAGGELLREYAQHAATVADLAWEPGRNWLTVAAYGAVVSYDLHADEPVKVRPWKGAPLKLAWSQDGRNLAHGNQDQTVHFWNIDQETPAQMQGFPAKVRELDWYLNSRYLATGGGAAVCLWDCYGAGPEGRTPQMLLDDDAALPLSALACQPTGFLIAAGDQSGKLKLWQPANRKTPCVGRGQLRGAVTLLRWSHSEKLLLAGSETGEVVMFRV